MKVVVYFRQAGGIAARDYPAATTWVEDENEIPVPQFSTFNLERNDSLSADIVVQIEAVNPWLEARRGVVVATFTEIEDGSSRRPAYGAARKEAAHQRAVLLVGTNNTIAGQTFEPAAQDGIDVVTLQAPESSSRLRQVASGRTPVVLYFRTGSHGVDDSALLAKQRDGIQRANISSNILAEFTEEEAAGSIERPQLEKALALCRKHGALLFLGTTDAIGDGDEFLPTFTDVPYEVAYRKEYDWPDLIPVSTCPYAVALLFGQKWVRGNIPLYLANASGADLFDVEVLSRGSTLAGGEIFETTTGSKNLGAIPPGHACLVEAYDVYFDGDFLTEYQIIAKRADGTPYRGRALVKDIPLHRWLEVRDQNITRS